jgi:Tfp pilus assembly protein PilO
MNRIIITLVFFAAAIGTGIFLLVPRVQEYQELRAEIDRKEIELQYSQEYQLELEKISSELDLHKDALTKIGDSLPIEFSIPAFYANIQSMSSQSGMVLTSIGETGVREGGGVKERSYNISVVGSFPNFKNFLSVLEKSAKLIEIENFAFSSALVEGGGENKLNVGIKTFSY